MSNVVDTTIHQAATSGDAALVQRLVEKQKAPVNTKDKSGMTPLMRACERNHSKVVRYLLSAKGKADVNFTSNSGWTALMYATRDGHIEIVRLLCEEYKAKIDVVDQFGWSAVTYAAKNGHLEVLKYLVNQAKAKIDLADKGGWTPLMYAAEKGYLSIVRFLVEETQCDINATNKNGWTALAHASWYGHLDVVRYLAEEAKIQMHTKDKDGKSPLDCAIKRKYHDIVRFLKYPLHDAVIDMNMKRVKYYVEEIKVDIALKDDNGQTILSVAQGEILRYFLDNTKGPSNYKHKLIDNKVLISLAKEIPPSIQEYLHDSRHPTIHISSIFDADSLHVTKNLIDKLHSQNDNIRIKSEPIYLQIQEAKNRKKRRKLFWFW